MRFANLATACAAAALIAGCASKQGGEQIVTTGARTTATDGKLPPPPPPPPDAQLRSGSTRLSRSASPTGSAGASRCVLLRAEGKATAACAMTR